MEPQAMTLNGNAPAQESGNRRPVIIAGLVIMLAVMAVFMLMSGKKGKQGLTPQSGNSAKAEVPTATLIPYPTQGVMTVYYEGEKRKFPVKDPITLKIKASSEGKAVVGYDIILSYDTEAFSVVSAQSLLQSFSLRSFKRPSYLSLSGFRSLQDNDKKPWKNKAIAQVVLQPKKAGTFELSLTPQGSETSKLVDDSSQVIYPKTGKLQLDIYE